MNNNEQTPQENQTIQPTTFQVIFSGNMQSDEQEKEALDAIGKWITDSGLAYHLKKVELEDDGRITTTTVKTVYPDSNTPNNP
jgi:hypothetical protein